MNIYKIDLSLIKIEKTYIYNGKNTNQGIKT